ncbi:hypothetical protein, partial [Clostridium perfringens]
CITLLLSTLYGYYRSLPRLGGVLLTVLTLLGAVVFYALIVSIAFSLVRDDRAAVTIVGLFGAIFVAFIVLTGWSALYFGINFY